MPGTDDLTSVRIGAQFIAAIPPNGNALEVFDADGARTVVINAAGALVSALVASNITTADDVLLSLGTGNDARFSWDTTDANANEMLLQMPAGTGTNVPVLAIGQSIESVDLGLYNGVTEPRIAIFGVGAVTTAPVIEFRKARGTIASPTVVTSGDDLGTINFYGAVAAGEYVLGASIRADMAGTIATTRGPSTLTFLTATDAAPSVLTAALTLSAAQAALIGGALTVTGTSTFNGNLILPANVDLTFTGTTGTNDIVLTNALADALSITDGAADILVIDTNTGGNVIAITAAVNVTGAITGTTSLSLGVAAGATGDLIFNGTTSGVVTVTTQDAAGTWTLKLPADDGDAGEQLQTDGSGVSTWEAAGSSRAVKNVLGVIDPQAALDRIMGRGVYAFRYREGGLDATGRKVGSTTGDYTTEYHGVMAEEYPEVMHHNGRIFSPVSAFGETAAAIKALVARIVELEQRPLAAV